MKTINFDTKIEQRTNKTAGTTESADKTLKEVYALALNIGKTIEQHKSDKKSTGQTWGSNPYSTKPKLGRIK